MNTAILLAAALMALALLLILSALFVAHRCLAKSSLGAQYAKCEEDAKGHPAQKPSAQSRPFAP